MHASTQPLKQSVRQQIETLDSERRGQEMLSLARDLYPICRSLTGPGNRETLARIQRDVPLDVHEVASGTPVFDWTVPPEWTLREAWIKNAQGQKVVDFADHNLHVVGYSQPVHTTLSREALEPHLHSIPESPDWIPYRTSYYQETWGFCLAHKIKAALPGGEYEVYIDAELKPGHLTYGELVLPGQRDETVLFSTHICHPSLANDNLSGIAVATQLIQLLAEVDRVYTYRFLFIPGTIGSITWLALHPEETKQIRHGLVLSCVGDAGQPHYKRSRAGDALIDRAVAQVFRQDAADAVVQDFSPYGYDERQYGSPGVNLPVGLFTRSPHGTFPEYHTSADNLDLLSREALTDSLRLLLESVAIVEGNASYRNLYPMGEPQLGRRGLYASLGGANDRADNQLAMLWILNQSDGAHSLLDIAERSGYSFARIRHMADVLVEHALLEEVGAP